MCTSKSGAAPDFDAARGSAPAWIVMLARTRAIDKLRHAANRLRMEQPRIDLRQWRSPDPGPDEQSAHNESVARLQHALRLLSAEQREAIELAFFSGLTHSELSVHLGAPLGTVKTRIRQAMLKLRRDLVETKTGDSA